MLDIASLTYNDISHWSCVHYSSSTQLSF